MLVSIHKKGRIPTISSDHLSKMLSQMRNPLIHPSRQYPFADISTNPRFSRKSVTPSSLSKYPFLQLEMNLRKMGVISSFNLQRIEPFSSTHVVRCDASPLSDGHSGSRISRVGRGDAEKALFDYLHCTRSLHFTDAEHMSKNSPIFIEDLIAKVENEEGFGRSITRFLRFHPINEFEPFFESLGLKPYEFLPLLPRNLMFLSDDVVLVDNYHVLCNYGVPRSKIGKMYVEAPEMFRYDYGVLLLKLQAYENLGLSKPTIIKLISCCPTFLVGDINADFLRVLERLKAFGVELDNIRGCFSEKSVYNWSRILEMLNFLNVMGCNKKDLTRLIREHPRFVFDNSGKKIYMLVALLLKLGLKMDKVLVLFIRYPRILVGNFAKNLWTSVHFLFEIGMESEEIAVIVSTHTQVLGSCTPKKVGSVLKNLDLTAAQLCEIIKEDPDQLSNLVAKGNVNAEDAPKIEGIFLREKTNFLLKIGFVENSDDMAKALRKFRGRGDQLQERFDLLVNAGLDYHTVTKMVKLVPPVLNQSTGVIEKKIDYLVNHLGYPLELLAEFPSYLCYNMEKIKLRFTMYKWLHEHGIVIPTNRRKMIKSTLALSTLLACAEERFVKYVVSLHPDAPEVWETLKKQYMEAKGC